MFTPKPMALKWIMFHCSLCLTQNAWLKVFLLLASQPAASSESAFISLCTHTLMLYGSISSDLTALEWDLILHGEPAPDQSNPAALWVTSLECCIWEGWPCCGCGLFPPHSLIPAASEAGQGTQTPSSASLQEDQSVFSPYSFLWSAALSLSWSSWKCSIHSMCP